MKQSISTLFLEHTCKTVKRKLIFISCNRQNLPIDQQLLLDNDSQAQPSQKRTTLPASRVPAVPALQFLTHIWPLPHLSHLKREALKSLRTAHAIFLLYWKLRSK